MEKGEEKNSSCKSPAAFPQPHLSGEEGSEGEGGERGEAVELVSGVGAKRMRELEKERRREG